MKQFIAICFIALLSVGITPTETQDPGVPASVISLALPGCGEDDDCPAWSTDCCVGVACNNPLIGLNDESKIIFIFEEEE